MKHFSKHETLLVDEDWYLEQYPDVKASGLSAYRHFMSIGVTERRNPNAYFNTNWYLEAYPDVAIAGHNPLAHYLEFGVRDNRDPSELFSTRDYLAVYPDVAAARMNPLLHYYTHGRYEGRVPVSKFTLAMYGSWITANDTLNDEDRRLIRRHINGFDARPLISVIVPVYNTVEPYLRALVASVKAQLYPDWELCLADDASTAQHIRPLLEEFAAGDERIHCVFRSENGNICAATNSALEIATGAFIALVDHDDLLPEHALYEVAAALDANPDIDILYSDQDRIDARGRRSNPHFKTDWNLDLLLGQNMVNHLGVYRRALVERIGGMRIGFEGSQDYDLVLRASDATTPKNIAHIPTILYHWRMDTDAANFSQSQREQCFRSAKRAVEDHFARRGEVAEVVPATSNKAYARVIRTLPAKKPLVSILIPTRDKADLLKQCLEGLLSRTDYDPLEIIIIDNDSIEADTTALFNVLRKDRRIRILPFKGTFNFSAMNNAAAREANGEVLLLLNNDTEVIHADWLTEMVSHAIRPEVGAVGAKLYYTSKLLQHGGVILGMGGVAGHYFLRAPRHEGGNYSDLFLTRRVSCVTGACLALRRAIYLEIGGLDAERLKIAFNDVDLCIRLAKAGYQIIWTPYAELFHHESASRGSDQTPDKVKRFRREAEYMMRQWADELADDPFYNPNLALDSCYGHLAAKSRRSKPWIESINQTRTGRPRSGL